MKTLVMMPTYNEIETLEKSVADLFRHNPSVELLVIDDNSPDGTGALADRLAASLTAMHVLHRGGKEGLGKAYLAGISWGIANGFEFLVQMDADGSHRAQDLPKLLERAGLDQLVIGSRWIPGGAVRNWPWYRMLISRFGNFYAARMLGSNLGDLTAGFRVYGKELLLKLPLESVAAQGYGFQVEMTKNVLAIGSKVTEVPIEFVERENGVSKMTLAIVLEAFVLATKWGVARLTRR
jgi:glycosyltransferase involved in cell wall biosynthesis